MPPAPSAGVEMPRREYGRTGISLSVIGFGGILVMGKEQDRANRLVAEAVELCGLTGKLRPLFPL